MFAFRRPEHEVIRQRVPVLVSCYRPPSRLSLNEIYRGLRESINVWADVMTATHLGNDFDFRSKQLVTVVIIRLFHHMLEVRTRFGYISTGEALVFLEISESARLLSFAVCVPRHDVEANSVTGLHRTAAAQVLAFTLRALRSEQMAPEWYAEARRDLWTWRINPDNVFNSIPPMIRKLERYIEYVPHDWRPLLQESPIQQRAPIMIWPGFKRPLNEAAFNDSGVFKFLSIYHIDPAGERIDQRPFCTPECLYGFGRPQAMDETCPNFRHHGDAHIWRQDLLDRLKRQLDADLVSGNPANHQLICRSGPYTALFKVRLASHGYTFLMKGVIPSKVKRLRHEAIIYSHLMALQSIHVPVALGLIQTQNAISSVHGEYANFLVFGGLPEGIMPLRQCVAAGVDKDEIANAVDEAIRLMHLQRVVHFDPEPRNMLYDVRGQRAMIVDFERALYYRWEWQWRRYPGISAAMAGVAEGRSMRVRIEELARAYVRGRVVEFCDRGISFAMFFWM